MPVVIVLTRRHFLAMVAALLGSMLYLKMLFDYRHISAMRPIIVGATQSSTTQRVTMGYENSQGIQSLTIPSALANPALASLNQQLENLPSTPSTPSSPIYSAPLPSLSTPSLAPAPAPAPDPDPGPGPGPDPAVVTPTSTLPESIIDAPLHPTPTIQGGRCTFNLVPRRGYLVGLVGGARASQDLQSAADSCSKSLSCTGIVYEQDDNKKWTYTLRLDHVFHPIYNLNGPISWIKQCPGERSASVPSVPVYHSSIPSEPHKWKVAKRIPNVSFNNKGEMCLPNDDYQAPEDPSILRDPKYAAMAPLDSSFSLPSGQWFHCVDNLDLIDGGRNPCVECRLDKDRDYGGPDTNIDYYLKNGNTIGIVTMSDSHSFTKWKRFSDLNKQEYADRHGHTLYDIQAKGLPNPTGRDTIHYKKMAAVRSVLDKHNWVMWMDADAVFTNMRKRIADIIDDRYDIIYADTRNPESTSFLTSLNTGVVLFKNTPWTHAFLTQWEANCRNTRDTIPDYEQGYFLDLILHADQELASHFKPVSHRVFNSNPPYCLNTDLIVHFYGRNPDDKERSVMHYVHNVVRS